VRFGYKSLSKVKAVKRSNADPTPGVPPLWQLGLPISPINTNPDE